MPCGFGSVTFSSAIAPRRSSSRYSRYSSRVFIDTLVAVAFMVSMAVRTATSCRIRPTSIPEVMASMVA